MPEIGYGGSVGEANWSTLAPNLGVDYTVEGVGDWLATPVPLSDRTLSIAAGTGTGKGITSVTDAPVQKTLASVSSGYRWDMIVRRRNTSGAGGASSFEVIEGTSSAFTALNARQIFGPSSTVDDQPIWFVRVDAGSTLITDMVDVRVWQANGGAVAKSEWPLQYLTKLGSTVQIGDTLCVRTFAADGLGVTWKKYALQPTLAARTWGYYRTTSDSWSDWGTMTSGSIADAPAGDYTITASATVQSSIGGVAAGAKRIIVNAAVVGIVEQDDHQGNGTGWTSKQHAAIYRHAGGAMAVAYAIRAVSGASVRSASLLIAYNGPVG